MNILWLGIFGVIVHIILLCSIFDIYFTSPIIHGMTAVTPPDPVPAKRAVLFVADGLRADKFFEVDKSGISRVPYLRNVLLSQGAWGVSHTRVPTESRPGHVALIAGFYEDVSAVAKGWKENPVEFDSLFNRSYGTWAWGSPDILPMFAKGKPNIFINTYPAELEDFASADASSLDTWVFDKFEEFLANAKNDSNLMNQLSQRGIIFFLHLLGIDTNGHAHKPNSEEYLKNIELVDRRIEKIVSLVESFYNDDHKTAYIFTSDHGMTDWGSHGSGENHETHTPFLAWGAGIRGPLGAGRDVYKDGYCEEWQLTQVRRVDIQQADVTPLIAVLIGIPFPVNSVGMLPVDYLSTNWSHIAAALLANSDQIIAQYEMRKSRKKENTLLFKEDSHLTQGRRHHLEEMISSLLDQHRYHDTVQVGIKLIELALKGTRYYEKYDRFSLCCSIFFTFLLWILYLVILLIRDHTFVLHKSLECIEIDEAVSAKRDASIVSFGGTLAVLISTLLYVQNDPLMYYAYCLLPVLLLTLVLLKWKILVQAKQYIVKGDYSLVFILAFILGIIGMELLVNSFFERCYLTLGIISIGLWPTVTTLIDTNKWLVLIWGLSCGLMGIFPLLPVVGRESSYQLVGLTGWLTILLAAYSGRRPEVGLIQNNRQVRREPNRITVLLVIQIFLLWVSIYLVENTADSISNKGGLPILNQIISWSILALSFVFPFLGSHSLLTRLLHIGTSLMAPVILMSISYEGLFCLGLCCLMFLWIYMEYQFSDNHINFQDFSFESPEAPLMWKNNIYKLRIGDIRRAYFFIYFIFMAFFGTGNIASINSFEPASVYCFLTVFNPFVMGFLLLLKVMIPFLLVSCAFRAILLITKVPPGALFFLILIMSDFMGLHFFFYVQDSGSWLEIGTSISHYVIVMVTTIFILLLYGLAYLLTSSNITACIPNFKRHIY